MKKIFISTLLLILVLLFTSCTDNHMARINGGTMEIKLNPGQKFVNVTWKESSIWYVTRPMNENDIAEVFTFQENSPLGIMQGKVIFIESK
jgi:hypothetical protein